MDAAAAADGMSMVWHQAGDTIIIRAANATVILDASTEVQGATVRPRRATDSDAYNRSQQLWPQAGAAFMALLGGASFAGTPLFASGRQLQMVATRGSLIQVRVAGGDACILCALEAAVSREPILNVAITTKSTGTSRVALFLESTLAVSLRRTQLEVRSTNGRQAPRQLTILSFARVSTSPPVKVTLRLHRSQVSILADEIETPVQPPQITVMSWVNSSAGFYPFSYPFRAPFLMRMPSCPGLAPDGGLLAPTGRGTVLLTTPLGGSNVSYATNALLTVGSLGNFPSSLQPPTTITRVGAVTEDAALLQAGQLLSVNGSLLDYVWLVANASRSRPRLMDTTVAAGSGGENGEGIVPPIELAGIISMSMSREPFATDSPHHYVDRDNGGLSADGDEGAPLGGVDDATCEESIADATTTPFWGANPSPPPLPVPPPTTSPLLNATMVGGQLDAIVTLSSIDVDVSQTYWYLPGANLASLHLLSYVKLVVSHGTSSCSAVGNNSRVTVTSQRHVPMRVLTDVFSPVWVPTLDTFVGNQFVLPFSPSAPSLVEIAPADLSPPSASLLLDEAELHPPPLVARVARRCKAVVRGSAVFVAVSAYAGFPKTTDPVDEFPIAVMTMIASTFANGVLHVLVAVDSSVKIQISPLDVSPLGIVADPPTFTPSLMAFIGSVSTSSRLRITAAANASLTVSCYFGSRLLQVTQRPRSTSFTSLVDSTGWETIPLSREEDGLYWLSEPRNDSRPVVGWHSFNFTALTTAANVVSPRDLLVDSNLATVTAAVQQQFNGRDNDRGSTPGRLNPYDTYRQQSLGIPEGGSAATDDAFRDQTDGLLRNALSATACTRWTYHIRNTTLRLDDGGGPQSASFSRAVRSSRWMPGLGVRATGVVFEFHFIAWRYTGRDSSALVVLDDVTIDVSLSSALRQGPAKLGLLPDVVVLMLGVVFELDSLQGGFAIVSDRVKLNVSVAARWSRVVVFSRTAIQTRDVYPPAAASSSSTSPLSPKLPLVQPIADRNPILFGALVFRHGDMAFLVMSTNATELTVLTHAESIVTFPSAFRMGTVVGGAAAALRVARFVVNLHTVRVAVAFDPLAVAAMMTKSDGAAASVAAWDSWTADPLAVRSFFSTSALPFIQLLSVDAMSTPFLIYDVAVAVTNASIAILSPSKATYGGSIATVSGRPWTQFYRVAYRMVDCTLDVDHAPLPMAAADLPSLVGSAYPPSRPTAVLSFGNVLFAPIDEIEMPLPEDLFDRIPTMEQDPGLVVVPNVATIVLTRAISRQLLQRRRGMTTESARDVVQGSWSTRISWDPLRPFPQVAVDDAAFLMSAYSWALQRGAPSIRWSPDGVFARSRLDVRLIRSTLNVTATSLLTVVNNHALGRRGWASNLWRCIHIALDAPGCRDLKAPDGVFAANPPLAEDAGIRLFPPVTACRPTLNGSAVAQVIDAGVPIWAAAEPQ